MFEHVHVHNLPIFGSDLSPTIFQCNNIGHKRKNSLKFEVMWLNHSEFNQFVIDNWQCNISRHPNDMFRAHAERFKFNVKR